MRRFALAVLSVAVVHAAAARPAPAQDVIRFHAPSDSAIGVVAGDTVQLLVRHESGNTLQYARLTVHFDPTKIDVVGVLPFNLSGATLVPAGAGVVQVSGTGPAYGYSDLFYLRVVLRTGVTDGTYLWVNPDSMQTSSGVRTLAYTSGIGRVCHATYRWGDVDGNGRIDSRDALITLSAAVGLPVTGFQLGTGDVDGDALVSSRDALMMLTWSIGGYISASNRVALGIADACPGLAPPGEDLVFTGDTGVGPQVLRLLGAASTTPVTVPSVPAFVGEPRLAANGTSVAYSCSDLNGLQVCRIETDGSGYQQLTGGGVYARNPDWSPNGLKVAYTAQVPNSIRHVDADGTDDSLVAFVSTGQNPFVAWNRTGAQLSYSISGSLIVVNRDGTGGTAIPISPATISAFDVTRWSPAGDSIAFTTGYAKGIWGVPSGGGAPAGLVRLADMGSVFDWGPQGIVFSYGSNTPGFSGLWLMTPTGSLRRLTRGQDRDPAFRRNP